MAKQPTQMTAEIDEEDVADLTQTPEFQMALAKATTEIHDKLLAEVRAMMAAGTAPVASGTDDDNIIKLARAIAASNAEMADQGTNRKRVAPEILEARQRSHERMVELLNAAQDLPKADRPLYRVRAKGYFGDRLVEPFQRLSGGRIEPTRVYFMSSPNLALEPINASAKAIYEAFVGSIAGGERYLNGKAIPSPDGAKPLWMTKNGVLIAAPTATAVQHGMVMEAEPVSLDEVGAARPGVVEELISVDDPRATKIPVLGTIAPPATRGSSSPRLA